MQRLLILNLATDADDPALGFTTAWINAFARRVPYVEVISVKTGRLNVGPNVRVHTVGGAAAGSAPMRALRFSRILNDILSDGPVDACFVHMAAVLGALAGPRLRLAGIPMVLWYAHPANSLTLRAAAMFANRIVTSLPGSFPFPSPKLRVIGQGVDTEQFAPGAEPAKLSQFTVLYAGRFSPVKDLATLVQGFAQFRDTTGLDARLRLVGQPMTQADRRYFDVIERLILDLGLDENVERDGAIPFTAMPDQYRTASVMVNLTGIGSGDKVALEAMSSGLPCVLCNPDFSADLGPLRSMLEFRAGEPASLAESLSLVARATEDERASLCHQVRQMVVERHGMQQLITRILDAARRGDN